MEYGNIGHHGTKVYWYIGILVYWYIGMVYWYIGILETQPPACKHYLFLRFLDPSQVTIADWMPFELLKRCAHVQYSLSKYIFIYIYIYIYITQLVNNMQLNLYIAIIWNIGILE